MREAIANVPDRPYFETVSAGATLFTDKLEAILRRTKHETRRPHGKQKRIFGKSVDSPIRQEQEEATVPDCSEIGFINEGAVSRGRVLAIANALQVSPVLVAAIIENEYQSFNYRHIERNESAWGVKALNDIKNWLLGGSGEPSYGIAQIQASLAVNMIAHYWIVQAPHITAGYEGHLFTFERYFDEGDVAVELQNNPDFSLRVAAAIVADLEERITFNLENTHLAPGEVVGITVGSEEGMQPDGTYSITQRQLEDLIILAYRQGWYTDSGGGIYNLLLGMRTEDQTPEGWYRGILRTIAAAGNQEQIDKVRGYLDAAERCLTEQSASN